MSLSVIPRIKGSRLFNKTERNLISLGWGEGLSRKDIKLLRSARKEKETPSICSPSLIQQLSRIPVELELDVWALGTRLKQTMTEGALETRFSLVDFEMSNFDFIT